MESNLDKEIERLNKEISDLESQDKKESEISKLRKKLKTLKFKKEHKGLLKLTQGLEQGTKRLFKGLGTTIKTTGSALKKSDDFITREKLKEAEMLFNETKDPRGKIYCMMGIGELNYLNGNRKSAEKMFLKSIELAASYRFGIEREYAERLIEMSESQKGFPVNLP